LLKGKAAQLLGALVVKAHLIAAAPAGADHFLVVTVREPQAVIAGIFARDHHQLFVVECHMARLLLLRVSARPDDVAMLARDSMPVRLDVKDDGTRLAR